MELPINLIGGGVDVNPGEIVPVVLGAAVLIILWFRLRAFDTMAGQQLAPSVEAIRRAIETFDQRFAPSNKVDPALKVGARRRRGRKSGRRRP